MYVYIDILLVGSSGLIFHWSHILVQLLFFFFYFLQSLSVFITFLLYYSLPTNTPCFSVLSCPNLSNNRCQTFMFQYTNVPNKSTKSKKMPCAVSFTSFQTLEEYLRIYFLSRTFSPSLSLSLSLSLSPLFCAVPIHYRVHRHHLQCDAA